MGIGIPELIGLIILIVILVYIARRLMTRSRASAASRARLKLGSHLAEQSRTGFSSR